MRCSASSLRLPTSTPLVTSGMGMSRWMRYTRTCGAGGGEKGDDAIARDYIYIACCGALSQLGNVRSTLRLTVDMPPEEFTAVMYRSKTM